MRFLYKKLIFFFRLEYNYLGDTMLKRFSLRKISKYTILLLIVFLFYLFPKKEEYSLNIPVSNEIKANLHNIFLLNKSNYVYIDNKFITQRTNQNDCW